VKIVAQADSADVALALSLCDRADEITTAAFRRADLVVESKADRSPVSEADRAVELALKAELGAARPTDQILGEEFGHSRAPAGSPVNGLMRRWIIDPIDGTTNFIRRYPVWATLLALEVDGELSVGVVSAPALGRRWWAGRGLGAFASSPVDGEATPIHVSDIADLSNAYVLGSALSSWAHRQGPAGYVELATRAFWDRSLGDFWSHMLVAEGCAEVGVDPIGNLWDLAALQVIVEEAGGTFTDLGGRRRADGGHGVSTNGLLHTEVLEILSQGRK
jgi:histidinol-phosphatase